mmetsp:Transcript_11483/g.9903  ORF Transcript_11483/g.9903 Transcript_11483/m.9903 type:complete len:141 (-) Transcript_11483:244-666(-)
MDVAEKLHTSGYHIGIQSNSTSWSTLMGANANKTTFSSLSLWYTGYDGSATFGTSADYTFGGWSKPELKQFQANSTVCGIVVNVDATNSTSSGSNGSGSSNSTSPSGGSSGLPSGLPHPSSNSTKPSNSSEPHQSSGSPK